MAERREEGSSGRRKGKRDCLVKCATELERVRRESIRSVRRTSCFRAQGRSTRSVVGKFSIKLGRGERLLRTNARFLYEGDDTCSERGARRSMRNSRDESSGWRGFVACIRFRKRALAVLNIPLVLPFSSSSTLSTRFAIFLPDSFSSPPRTKTALRLTHASPMDVNGFYSSPPFFTFPRNIMYIYKYIYVRQIRQSWVGCSRRKKLGRFLPCLPGTTALGRLSRRRGIVTRLVFHHLLVDQLLPLVHRVLPLVYAVVVRAWRGLQGTRIILQRPSLFSAAGAARRERLESAADR